jgi:uncharacterized membrane protein YfcA
MIKMRVKTLIELLILTFFFKIAIEVVSQKIPWISSLSADASAMMRLLMFVAIGVAFGAWIRQRLSSDILDIGVGIFAGIVLAYWHRMYRGDAEFPYAGEDGLFALAIVFGSWIVVFVGVIVMEGRVRVRERNQRNQRGQALRFPHE